MLIWYGGCSVLVQREALFLDLECAIDTMANLSIQIWVVIYKLIVIFLFWSLDHDLLLILLPYLANIYSLITQVERISSIMLEKLTKIFRSCSVRNVLWTSQTRQIRVSNIYWFNGYSFTLYSTHRFSFTPHHLNYMLFGMWFCDPIV